MKITEGFVLVPVEPSDEQIRRILAVRWPATYRGSLRFSGSGPKTVEQTERDISEARAQYHAALSANTFKHEPYDEAAELAACRAHWEKNPNCLFSDMWLGWKCCAQSRDGSVSDE